MKFKTLLLVLLLMGTLQAKSIKVAIAANVAYAMDELKKEFHSLYPDIQIDIIIGGTGKLYAQIQHHAPYDILMAANMLYPENLYKSGDAITRPIVYAQGSLALLSPKGLKLDPDLKSLTLPSIHKIALANPKTAPYGVATVEALKHAKLYDQLRNKFVYGESISQTVTYATRVTDMGFIAKSALYSPKLSQFKQGVHWVEVNPKLYTPIDQGIVLLKHAQQRPEASAFFTFVLGQRAKTIFEKFGYRIP